jgi:hypothetical protein
MTNPYLGVATWVNKNNLNKKSSNSMVIMRIFLFFLFLPHISFCQISNDSKPKEEAFTPWFTGPIIAPIGVVVPLGDVEFDNYLFFQIYTGAYNSNWEQVAADNFYVLSPQLLYYFGLTPWMDIEINPSFSYSFTQGRQSVQFGDFTAALDFQLYKDDDFWFPGIKLTIGEVFPTGKYQNLNPDKLGTDQGGNGTFGTNLSLVLYKIYHLWDLYSMSVTFSNAYTFNTSVRVKGFNAYGGGIGTKGTVDVGNGFQSILSFEFSLNQNWNLSLDSIWTHIDGSRFTGQLGEDALMENPSEESLSFCPAIEYGFSENLGITAGCWFSALGRNTQIFRNGAINIYCYF